MALKNTVGKLSEEDNIRSIWAREDEDFTPWLGEAIGVELSVIGTEMNVGPYFADIYAVDVNSDSGVVIENQYGKSDHDHLGKSLTYAAGMDASLIVWIVEHATEEHRATIEWLNNNTADGIGFFLCEAKIYRIGNSDPALHFKVLEEPNEFVKKKRKSAAARKGRNLPNIKAMLDWGVVSPGDILVAKGHEDCTAELQADGNVRVGDETTSIHKWLSSVTGWSNVQTYTYAIQQRTGKLLSEIRREHMEAMENGDA